MKAQININVVVTVPVEGTTLEDALVNAKTLAHDADLPTFPWRRAEWLDGKMEVTGVFDER